MATKKVNIDIVAKDRSRRALQSVQGNLDRVKGSVFNVRNALIGLGAGLAIRSLVNTGKQIEGLQVRLKFLFGSAQEGAKAFDEMAKFASEVPFSLEEIQQGSGVLAVVSKDAEELAELMRITGNVAAVTGLDFRTASEQIQRSMSAGIGAADLFRDRGVRAMLGFKAGATVSIEETVTALQETFGAGGKFDGATKELANTLEGTLSMIGDKVFNFQRTILDAGFFPELKNQFGDLNKFLEDNANEVDRIAVSIGTTLGFAVEQLGKGAKLLKDNMDLVVMTFKILISLKIASFLMAGARAIQAMVVATTAMVALSGPGGWALIAGATTAAAAAFIGLGEVMDNIKLKIDENMSAFEKEKEEIKKNTDAIEDNTRVLHINKKIKESGLKKDIESIQAKYMTEQQLAVHNAKKQLDIINKYFEDEQNLTENDKQILQALTVKIHSQLRDDLEQIRKDEILDIAKKNDKELQMMRDHYKKQVELMRSFKFSEMELEKLSKDQVMDLTKASGRELIGELAKHNREVFMINKALAIKDAVVNTARGISKALALGPFGIPLAVMIGGLGAVQIATIAKQEYTGRQLGGRVRKGEPYIVGESGREMFVPNQDGNIVPNHDMKQGVNVNFNINTVDARGFNELLVNSRGVIVNLINSAVNEKGRAAII